MTIHDNGIIAFPLLQSTTSTAGGLKTLLIDINGQLVSGSSVSSISSSGWQLGGNTGSGSQNQIGTTDADLIFITGPTGSTIGTEKMRITQAGNIAVANNNQILLSGTDLNHGLGAFTTDGTHTQFATRDINGPVLYGYNGGALGSNQVQPGIAPPIQKIALQWDQNGYVHIGNSPGNTSHPNAALTVYGESVSTAHYVTQNNWSDFVFDKKYTLMPLTELESFYKKNQHLPNVPSAKEMKQNGNNLGETDAILLQKVEELTLYIVELKKEVEALKKGNK